MPHGLMKIVSNIGNVFFGLAVISLSFASLSVSVDKGLRINFALIASYGSSFCRAIDQADMERRQLGLPSMWPKTARTTTNNINDISSMTFSTSAAYFNAIYQEMNCTNSSRKWNIKGFDYCLILDRRIKCRENEKISSQNNIWLIAANVREDDNERIPLLITRNVDVTLIEQAINNGLKSCDFNKSIDVRSSTNKTPLGNGGFVAVFKGGKTIQVKSKSATLGYVFGEKEFPAREPSKPRIVYLNP